MSRSHSRPGSVRSEQLLPQALESRSPRALLLSAARRPLARSVDGFQSVQCAGNPFRVLDVACSVSRPLRPCLFLAPRGYCAWQSTAKPRIRVSAARSSSPGHSRPAESWLPRSSAPEPRRRWCTAPSHRQALNATCTGSRLVPATDDSRPRQWAKSCGRPGVCNPRQRSALGSNAPRDLCTLASCRVFGTASGDVTRQKTGRPVPPTQVHANRACVQHPARRKVSFAVNETLHATRARELQRHVYT